MKNLKSYNKNQTACFLSMAKVKMYAAAFLAILLFAAFNEKQPQVTNAEFNLLLGGRWVGKLTYLDYTSKQKTSILADLVVSKNANIDQYLFSYEYPKEPQENNIKIVNLLDKGQKIDYQQVISKNITENSLQIITTVTEKDIVFRYTYKIENNKFSIRKEEKEASKTDFIERNIYEFTRQLSPSQHYLLTPSQMQKDIAVVKSTFENVLAGTYRYNTKEEIEAYFAEIKQKCSKDLDEKAFFVLLSQLTEKIKCGHTFLSPYNLNSKVAKRLFAKQFLPFYFVVVDSKLIITHNLSDNLAIKQGDEIVAINNISAKTIIDSLLTVSRTDGKNSTAKQYCNINVDAGAANGKALFDLYFPFFFGEPTWYDENATVECIVKTQSIENQGFEQKIKLLSLAQRNKKYQNLFGEIPDDEKTWNFKILPITGKAKTAHLQLGTFAFWNKSFDKKYKFWLDSVFKIVKTEQIANLIVDIRGNVGGSDDILNEVLAYLMNKPFGCENPTRYLYPKLTTPDSLKNILWTWDEDFKADKSANKFKINNLGFYENQKEVGNCKEKQPNKGAFEGKLYLVTDASNSSATFLMAQTLRNAQRATLIGEPTGGNLQGINGLRLCFLQLPNSNFEIDIPLVFQTPSTAQKDSNILPDVLVKTSQESIAKGEDIQLQYILKLLK